MSVRDKIRSADDRTVDPMEVPEWGVTLHLVAPDAIARGNLQQAIQGDRELEDYSRFYARVIAATACDPDTGELLYDAANDDDVAELAAKNGAVVERVGKRGLKVAGMDAEAVDEGKDDSSSTPSDATSTD